MLLEAANEIPDRQLQWHQKAFGRVAISSVASRDLSIPYSLEIVGNLQKVDF